MNIQRVLFLCVLLGAYVDICCSSGQDILDSLLSVQLGVKGDVKPMPAKRPKAAVLNKDVDAEKEKEPEIEEKLHEESDEWFTYLGCFKEDLDNRSSPYEHLKSEEMYPEMCFYHCKDKGYNFFAVFNYDECYCSDENYGIHGESGDCMSICKGDRNYVCGGLEENSVYKVGGKKKKKLTLMEMSDEEEGYTNGWKQLACKFWNRLDKDVTMHFKSTDRNVPDSNYGVIKPGEKKDLTSYAGNQIYIKDVESNEILQMITVRMNVLDYDFDGVTRESRLRDPVYIKEKAAFKKEYYERTGREWLQTYPREPVKFHIHDPVEVGHTQYVTSRHFKWTGKDDLPGEDTPPMVLEITTVSISPKIFILQDVISDEEAQHIIDKTEGRLKRSVVSTAGVVSNVRTSANCWLPTSESLVVKNIFGRIANILQIDEKHLRHDMAAENLQVVYYNTTQQYREHHDYLEPDVYVDSDNVQRGQNRLATILFYLNEPEEGGETAFPLSSSGADTHVKPKKGSAVLFYSMLEDGNLDIKSQHAGRPPTIGEKYAANLWIWEPRWL